MRILLLTFVTISIIFFYNSSYSNENCSSIFSREAILEKNFSRVTEIQAKIESWKFSVDQTNSPKIREAYEGILEMTQELLEYLISDYPSVHNVSSMSSRLESRFKTVRRLIADARSEGKLGAERLSNTSFEKLIENPELTLPERVYPVSTPKGTLKVSFSKEVTEALLHDTLQSQQRIAQHLLSAIQHGIVGATGLVGIKILHNTPGNVHLYEVKVIKHHISERLIGFMNDDILMIVVFSDKHLDTVISGASTVQRAIDYRKKYLNL